MNTSDCVFCKIINNELPSTKIMENDHALAFLTIEPESPGHTLVIPKKHFRNIHDIPTDELLHVMSMVKSVAAKYPVCKIIQNNEKPLQDVFHLHFHVIPYRGNK